MVREPATRSPSAEQVEQGAQARDAAARLRTAAAVATFDAWTLGIFAVLSALFALLDWTGLVFALVLAGAAWNEIRGRNLLRRFELKGLRILVHNQLGLLTVFVAYAAVMIYSTLTAPDIGQSMLQDSPELAELLGGQGDATAMLASIDPLVRTLSVVVYACLIIVVILYQGGSALYYHSRRKFLLSYLGTTASLAHPARE